ncbi:hypothetical protein B9479_006467 [Cryptococcus floricola]|uniref:ML-like domain-containing protein n=1 Tax=Cryptococcus floricola TaxID=2591691 RepID=A0A5D3AS82_9TREE|nr:hypothetical protein B9479_006467 [Cryptococcus floricola]
MLILAILLGTTLSAWATPLQPTFSSCLLETSPIAAAENLLDVNDVYASLVPGRQAKELELVGNGRDVLRLDLVGVTGAVLNGYDNTTNKLATLFTDTHAASFSVYSSTSWLCNSLFPANLPTPYYPYNTTYCPLAAGDFALNVSIPLYRSYALTTLRTRIRVVDTSSSAANLACIDIHVSPYKRTGWYYELFLYLPVAILLGFWLVSWGARFVTGWIVGSGVAEYGQKESAGARLVTGGSSRREATMRKWGTMIISGLSGERLSVSGGLLRFVTPGVRDILFHIQYAAMLGMISVQWPEFSYPIFAQGAWAHLLGNTTIVQSSDSERIDTYPSNYTPSLAFSGQMSDSQYPLYMDDTAFDPLLDLHHSSRGMESFATAVGLRAQDLFGTCLVIFLCIAGAVLVISLTLWFFHGLMEYLFGGSKHGTPVGKRATLGTSPRPSLGGKETLEGRNASSTDMLGSLPTQSAFFSHKSSSPGHLRRIWLRFRPRGEAGAFHTAALYGNLIRLILVFHLPVTIFSMYQLCLGSQASIVSRVFAALAFAFISVLFPALILWKIYKTPTGKLYDATRTLLSLGPMYNIYVEKKQMYRALTVLASLVIGIAVGAGQGSGLAQAIVLIIVELVLLIVPGVWYPWGEGASMGAPNALLGALRLISVVLVMLLAKIIGMSDTALDWIAYAVLILQAIIFVFFLFMLFTKIIEGSIRLFGGVHFDESTHPLDGGIFAVIMDLDCLNPVRGGKAAERRRRKHGSRQLQKNVYEAGSLSTQMMLDRHSQGVPRQPTAEQSTPFLYPDQPPLGPPPIERQSSDRRSSESRSEERHGEANIMDAWRPAPGPGLGYAPPGMYVLQASSPPISPVPNPAYGTGNAPSRSFSRVRGGRSNFEHPYDIQGSASSGVPVRTAMAMPTPTIKVSQAGQRPMSPPHNRQYSSSALIEMASSPQNTPPSRSIELPAAYPTSPPAQTPQGIRPDRQGQRPPALAIPKRRSLNDIKQDSDMSTDSHYSEHEKKKKKKGKRRSAGWFHRNETRAEDSESEESSDDEPGPSKRKTRKAALVAAQMREPEPFEDVSNLEPQPPAWKRMLGMKKKLGEEEELERDENKARKAALATESGSLFAGVQAPKPSPKKGFVVRRSGEGGPTYVPMAAPASPPGEPQSASTSFRVKRMGQPQQTPTPQRVDSPTEVKSVHASPSSQYLPLSAAGNSTGRSSGESTGEKKGFKVIRPAKSAAPSPAASSTGFVVNRRSSPLATPTGESHPVQTGYPPSSFVPMGRASLEDGRPPARPMKNPRRSSESQRGE